MDGVLHWFIGKPLQIAIVIALAVVTRSVMARLVERLTHRAITMRKSRHEFNTPAEEQLEASRREQRAASISQLLRSVITVTIWSIALLMGLATLGINIAPILASAGVVGVALGFGAQTMVKDYLAGIFLIIEDQYGVGDLVDVGPVVGVVESVELRVTRLRDLSGVVWYVRNGEILRVANRSQGWTMAIVDVPVSYDTDLDQVRLIIETVAEAMDNDPVFDELLLDKPEYAGVESVSGEAVVVRVTARALPDKQIAASREIRERIKVAFDAAGIQVPAVLRFPNQQK